MPSVNWQWPPFVDGIRSWTTVRSLLHWSNGCTERLACPRQDRFTFVGEALESGLLPQDDRNAEVLFELLDGLGEGGLANRECPGCASEMPFFREHDEVVQMLDLQTILQ